MRMLNSVRKLMKLKEIFCTVIIRLFSYTKEKNECHLNFATKPLTKKRMQVANAIISSGQLNRVDKISQLVKEDARAGKTLRGELNFGKFAESVFKTSLAKSRKQVKFKRTQGRVRIQKTLKRLKLKFYQSLSIHRTRVYLHNEIDAARRRSAAAAAVPKLKLLEKFRAIRAKIIELFLPAEY